MTFEELTTNLPLITGLLLGISLLFIFISIIFFRRGRRAPYWTQRRSAGQQGLRILMIAVFFLTLTGISCGLTLVYNYIEPDETVEDNNTAIAFTTNTSEPLTEAPTLTATATDIPATETAEPTATVETHVSTTSDSASSSAVNETETDTDASNATEMATPTTLAPSATDIPASATATDTIAPAATDTAQVSVSDTPEPSVTASMPPTAMPTETATATETSVPQATAIAQTTNLQPFATPSSQAELDISGVASGVSDQQQPLNSGRSFGTDLKRLYYFVDFENMVGGSLWQVRLYQSGALVYQQQALWGNTAEGETYFFITLPDGFAPGDYELQLIIGEQADPITTAGFSITG